MDQNQNQNQNQNHEEKAKQQQEHIDSTKKELETMVLKYARSETTVIQMQNKLDELDKKLKRVIKDNETLAAKAKALSNEKTSLTNNLTSKVVQLSQAEQELNRLRDAYEDTKRQLDSSRSKEKELCEINSKLMKDKNEKEFDLNGLREKIPECEQTLQELTLRLNETTDQKSLLESQVEQLRLQVTELTKQKDNTLAEKLKNENELKSQIDNLHNEIRVLKKKHAQTIKELNRELKILQSQVNAYAHSQNSNISIENNQLERITTEKDQKHGDKVHSNGGNQLLKMENHSMSIGSRTSSCTSIETANNNNFSIQNKFIVPKTGGRGDDDSDSTVTNVSCGGGDGNSKHCVDVGIHVDLEHENEILRHPNLYQSLSECEKHNLIDMVMRLQSQIVKKDEQVDLYQDQVNMLIEEVKKKGQLLQHYILREESGILSTDCMEKNKIQLAKKGSGIMSSLFSSSVNDSGMTLELSLEINKKLQALLEDTILKNMTLKESLSTLGSEIERLKKISN